MKNYAEMLQNGEGVEINKDEAMRYLKMAEDEDKINTENKIGENMIIFRVL